MMRITQTFSFILIVLLAGMSLSSFGVQTPSLLSSSLVSASLPATPLAATLTKQEVITPVNLLDYPPDPTADIPWTGDQTGAANIQAAFNAARTAENNQLGTNIPLLTLPSQAEWDSLNNGEKALWLINRERVDRGVHPLHGLETNVTSVAQTYAQYLLDNDTFAHDADGRDPWQRLEANPAIGACHDFLGIAENLFVSVTSGNSIASPIEQAIYNWMYADGSCCSWGHRHAILWFPYNDNSGPAGQEGFLGIGRANGGPYTLDGQEWNHAELIVMNVFDPCSTWDYGSNPATYTISGRVIDQQLGQGIAGVTVSAGAGHSNVTTDTGNYTIANLAAGNYTFSLTKLGSGFNPPTFLVNVTQDKTDQDFVVTVTSLDVSVYIPTILK